MIDSIYYESPKGVRQTETTADGKFGLSYTPVAVNRLIPFPLASIGDTWQMQTERLYIHPQEDARSPQRAPLVSHSKRSTRSSLSPKHPVRFLSTLGMTRQTLNGEF